MKTLIYCTKTKPYLYQSRYNLNYYLKQYSMDAIEPELRPQSLNGKVVASFDFDEWEEVARTDYTRKISDTGLMPMMKSNGETYNNRIVVNVREDYEYDKCKGSCLTTDELKDYGKGETLYAWHIDNLQVFDVAVELLDLTPVPNKNTIVNGIINKVRGMQYVYYKGEKCLLLPIKPQHCYNILQGNKTIEIRKSVPKEVRK